MSAPTQELLPPSATWDLSALFDSPTDPRIAESWARAHVRADEIANSYRGKIADPALTSSTLLAAIQEVEAFGQDTDKPVIFAHLLFAANSSDPEIGAFMAAQMEQYSEVRVKLLFLELELQAASQDVIDRVMQDPRLANYEHFVQRARAYSPHRLSEAEEVLLEEISNTGSRAWVRLFEELTSNHVYRYQAPGSETVEEKSEQELIGLMRVADRQVRQAAAESFTAGLREMNRTICFIYNNLLADKRVEDRLRKYEYPEHSRHLSNELPREVVDVVTKLVRDNYGLVARYYRVKRDILGLDKLTEIDRYAPLGEAEKQVDYEQARKLILEAFGSFHPELAARADEFFEKNWIDAAPRPGKGGGAFCNYITPDTHPVILITYLNRMNDVGTLAHELGHGVHGSLSREQSYLNFHGTLPLAELASIFGEMLVFERLMSEADDRDQLAMLADKIEGAFASVFRQVAMYTFEQRCHRARREEGELPPDKLSDYWQEELQSMFGDSVELSENHRIWWSYVGHFFFAPFYVYAYAFGELLTMALYQKAKREGPAFADRYIELLKLAGARSPQDLMATVDVDLTSPDFWQGGIDALEALVTRFEAKWAELK